MEVITATYIYL